MKRNKVKPNVVENTDNNLSLIMKSADGFIKADGFKMTDAFKELAEKLKKAKMSDDAVKNMLQMTEIYNPEDTDSKSKKTTKKTKKASTVKDTDSKSKKTTKKETQK